MKTARRIYLMVLLAVLAISGCAACLEKITLKY